MAIPQLGKITVATIQMLLATAYLFVGRPLLGVILIPGILLWETFDVLLHSIKIMSRDENELVYEAQIVIWRTTLIINAEPMLVDRISLWYVTLVGAVHRMDGAVRLLRLIIVLIMKTLFMATVSAH